MIAYNSLLVGVISWPSLTYSMTLMQSLSVSFAQFAEGCRQFGRLVVVTPIRMFILPLCALISAIRIIDPLRDVPAPPHPSPSYTMTPLRAPRFH